jgi:hypothetical protein
MAGPLPDQPLPTPFLKHSLSALAGSGQWSDRQCSTPPDAAPWPAAVSYRAARDSHRSPGPARATGTPLGHERSNPSRLTRPWTHRAGTTPHMPDVAEPLPEPPEIGNQIARALARVYADLAAMYRRLGEQGGDDAPRCHSLAAYVQAIGPLYRPRGSAGAQPRSTAAPTGAQNPPDPRWQTLCRCSTWCWDSRTGLTQTCRSPSRASECPQTPCPGPDEPELDDLAG